MDIYIMMKRRPVEAVALEVHLKSSTRPFFASFCTGEPQWSSCSVRAMIIHNRIKRIHKNEEKDRNAEGNICAQESPSGRRAACERSARTRTSSVSTTTLLARSSPLILRFMTITKIANYHSVKSSKRAMP